LLATLQGTALSSGEAGPLQVIDVQAAALSGASLVLVADDDGTGTGRVEECNEDNNRAVLEGPFCP
jgi:hypothetical protein